MSVKKLSDSRKLFGDSRLVLDYYYDSCICFSNDLIEYLKDDTCKEAFYNVEDIMKEFYYKILSFCVWNHLFLCEWSQHIKDMCDLHKAVFV